MHIPRATYRLQFNEHFRLKDALAIVPYLRDLGISHIYASPLFKACAHSRHGYDVCDFTLINPEIGTDADLEELASVLQANRMGLVVDIVPNHMGISTPENGWWWDVLKNGQASRYAGHFDIHWPSQQGKILLPVLGDTYDRVLRQGELTVAEEKDGFVLHYFDRRFPLAPNSLPKMLTLREVNADYKVLNELIQTQHYRLTIWREADEHLNFRRFFAVNTLAGLRMEDGTVFAMVHTLLHRWIEKGWIDGIRVDHPDGLREPDNYLRQLRALAPSQWIVAEKIVQPREDLPAPWPVQGTTGYDFLNQTNGLFINVDNEAVFTDFYAEFTDEPTDAALAVHQGKRLVLETLFRTEIRRLAGMLVQIAQQWFPGKAPPPARLRKVLLEFTASFPVYRTYVSLEKKAVSEQDRQHIREAAAKAGDFNPDLPVEAFEFLGDLLCLKFSGEAADDFVARFQQLTGPVMAKGVEDTVFYRFNRFMSLNEVGGDPGKFGVSIKEFHDFCRRQQTLWPWSLLASSTHDTKRSEDVRARLNVLSGMPGVWRDTVRRWSAMNERHRQRQFPDRNAEYLFYQTLAGAWPISLERITAYMEKASCEAKQHTDWNERNEDYDDALKGFIASAMGNRDFISEVESFARRIDEAGQINALAQTLVKLTAPGVPDIYQGNEIWDFSLVDPDNRRAVDYGYRRQLLAEAQTLAAAEIWARRDEGLPKLWLIWKTLARRAQNPNHFEGSYDPLIADGEKAGEVVAFIRGGKALTVVPRLAQQWGQDWKDTVLKLPAGNWQNEFTGEVFTGNVTVAGLFKHFPVALLVKTGED